jgi:hypothetical protein
MSRAVSTQRRAGLVNTWATYTVKGFRGNTLGFRVYGLAGRAGEHGPPTESGGFRGKTLRFRIMGSAAGLVNTYATHQKFQRFRY